MKKLLFAVPVFIGLLTLLIYQGCSKTEEDPRSSDSKNVVIFEDLSILDSSSPSPLENHIYRIEILGNNVEMEQVVWEAEKAGFDLSALNIYGIKTY